MKGTDVIVEIDELVLHGVAPSERDAVATALRAELTRRFAEHGVPASLLRGGAWEELDGGTFSPRAGETGERAAAGMGADAARALFEGLSRGSRSPAPSANGTSNANATPAHANATPTSNGGSPGGGP